MKIKDNILQMQGSKKPDDELVRTFAEWLSKLFISYSEANFHLSMMFRCQVQHGLEKDFHKCSECKNKYNCTVRKNVLGSRNKFLIDSWSTFRTWNEAKQKVLERMGVDYSKYVNEFMNNYGKE